MCINPEGSSAADPIEVGEDAPVGNNEAANSGRDAVADDDSNQNVEASGGAKPKNPSDENEDGSSGADDIDKSASPSASLTASEFPPTWGSVQHTKGHTTTFAPNFAGKMRMLHFLEALTYRTSKKDKVWLDSGYIVTLRNGKRHLTLGCVHPAVKNSKWCIVLIKEEEKNIVKNKDSLLIAPVSSFRKKEGNKPDSEVCADTIAVTAKLRPSCRDYSFKHVVFSACATSNTKTGTSKPRKGLGGRPSRKRKAPNRFGNASEKVDEDDDDSVLSQDPPPPKRVRPPKSAGQPKHFHHEISHQRNLCCQRQSLMKSSSGLWVCATRLGLPRKARSGWRRGRCFLSLTT